MEISIISKQEMKDLISSKIDLDRFNIISIIDPDTNYLFSETPSNILQLKFNDLHRQDWENDLEFVKNKGWIIFDESHAKEIIDFMNCMDKSKDLIVHCTAGICRSGAVGTFARVLFNVPYETFKDKNPHILPNSWVLHTLFKVYGFY